MRNIPWNKLFINAGIWLVMLAPVAMVVVSVVDILLDLRYLSMPTAFSFHFVVVIITLLGFLPTIVLGIMLIVRKCGFVSDFMQKQLLVLCIVYYLPFGLMMQCFSLWGLSDHFCSMTDDPAHYMQVDNMFTMQSEASWELFPDAPPVSTVFDPRSVKYHYYCSYDYGHSVYAEWTLLPKELAEEIARVEALLSGEETLLRMTYGNFECLAVPGLVWRGGKEVPVCSPFELEDSYSATHHLTMFAYNTDTGTVRYIYSKEQASSTNPPYYMTMKWDIIDSTGKPSLLPLP